MLHWAISSRNSDARISTGNSPLPVPKTKLYESVRALLHRLRANCAFARAVLYRPGSVSDPNYVLCDDFEDIDHVL